MTCTTPSHLIAPRGNLFDQPILSLESANILLILKSVPRILQPCARIIFDVDHHRTEDTVKAEDLYVVLCP